MGQMAEMARMVWMAQTELTAQPGRLGPPAPPDQPARQEPPALLVQPVRMD